MILNRTNASSYTKNNTCDICVMLYLCYMRYIKQEEIAKYLGYSSLKSFQSSSAHKRIMKGVESIINRVSASKEVEQSVMREELYYYRELVAKLKLLIDPK